MLAMAQYKKISNIFPCSEMLAINPVQKDINIFPCSDRLAINPVHKDIKVKYLSYTTHRQHHQITRDCGLQYHVGQASQCAESEAQMGQYYLEGMSNWW